MNGGQQIWTQTDYLLADVYDAVAGVHWAVANKDVPRAKWSELPKPHPRPGMETRRKITADDLRAFRERTKGV